MNQELLRELAKKGAQAELIMLRQRIAELEAIIEDKPNGKTPVAPAIRSRRPMSAAARKAIGVRMRKFWAERRAAGQKKSPRTTKS